MFFFQSAMSLGVQTGEPSVPVSFLQHLSSESAQMAPHGPVWRAGLQLWRCIAAVLASCSGIRML